ncbi:hypothetical protein BACCAP_02950 [Pseudoflavonifractor capillosus ATCC 29799]|uniref:Uncharacterized protein n=1 Tax=Pseudoflavonifractor capillosus ATCC 29799 TaxID=411467 RepID=A6NXK4_9FIRM|nr:hypothetical protein BACCAP_02950 [Pseudoflavonifractor capillosus ATCC 29799]
MEGAPVDEQYQNFGVHRLLYSLTFVTIHVCVEKVPSI